IQMDLVKASRGDAPAAKAIEDEARSIVDNPRKSAGNGSTNGNGHGHAKTPGAAEVETQTESALSTLAEAMREMQADAPACDVCGTITVRSGTCYKCVNCGNSMGCS